MHKERQNRMSAIGVPVLVINLATANRRWNNIHAQVGRHFPQSNLIRIDAVDWRLLPQDPARLPVTLFTQYLVSFPQRQSALRISHRQVDTLSSIAILLSHIKCWQWLLDHPSKPYVLIMEDDACFDQGFSQAWEQGVKPLLAVVDYWDVLVLGYFAVSGPESTHAYTGIVPHVMTETVPQLYGAHAYMVTRKGAEILLKNALPIDVQVDGLFLTLHELQRIKLHMLMQSVVSQCMDNVNREGSWHTHTIMSSRPTALTIVQGTPWPLVLCIAMFLFVVLIYWRGFASCSNVEGKRHP